MMVEQWMGRLALQELHDRRLEATLRHAVAHVPRYRDLAVSRGINPDAVSHENLADFPLTDKKLMTAEQGSFLADDAGLVDRQTAETGGSSGVWFEFFFDKRSKEIRRAGDLFGRTWAGWRVGDPMASVWGHRGDVAAVSTVRGRVANALLHRTDTLNAYDMDETVIRDFIARLGRHHPSLILGYASSLAFFAEYLGRHGEHGIRPAGIISSAETLDQDRRASIARQFHCPVLNRYGSREFATIAQQCELMGGLHIFSGRIHVEVLRPDGNACQPGERGEIVVTDLINGVMPFIRYRTGDIGVPTAEVCPCGRGMPLLASVEGRVSELIVGPNGKYYSCQSPRLFGSDIPGIEQMQVIQDRISDLEIRIVPGTAWTEASQQLLIDRMRNLLGEVEVRIVLTDSIPPAPSGKYRFTISKVSPFDRPG